MKPRKENGWSMKREDDTITTDHQEVANMFNTVFIQEVEDLKADIDKEFVEDPLSNLTAKNPKGTKFGLKTVSQKQLLKFLKKMKKKHSAGVDGLSLDKLVLGAKSLVYPLLQIVNQFIIIKFLII